MKLQPDRFDVQAITGQGPGWVQVGPERIEHSVIIGSRGERIAWNCASYDELGAGHFDELARLQPEVVIFGSGDRIRFPRPAWLRELVSRGIGLETMDTAAACRTYNILAQEGRQVVVALLLEQPR
ncbi:Mth938-like domain-containing protein [Ramlibacter tataouinensis]|uniref:Mth938-like domain-containing protein n=1 Tax=Ramlibacter tataouinensis TaxID=94132 RepID=UPI0022F38CA8|nr:Mth938-like domain-containing protein [Ramlibacter tataouinensis]WBY01705.1 Mth938-like domain-containing protein [Ramlibacter tataouinensis]